MARSDLIVRFNLVATAVFAATAAYAAADFSTTAQWIGAVTAMTLFTIGVVAFLWSYWTAVQRSREVDIAVSQLYLLLGPAIPKRVRRTMNLVLVAQFAIAFATTFARPDGPDGNPGSSLAVGFLAIMLGFGLNGLWASQHGSFQTRRELADERTVEHHAEDSADDSAENSVESSVGRGVDEPAPGADVPASGEEIGQNADHG